MTASARLWLALAAVGAALAFAGGALADRSPSGKATHHHAGDRADHRGGPRSPAECPPFLRCEFVPAAYQQNSSDPGDYGNYDLADRPADGLAVRFIVVHDTELDYESTVAEFQNPLAYVSAHYVIRAADGHVAQMVPTKDVAWHAGNWWVNSHSVGIENEGFATDGGSFTPRLYSSLAALTRYLAWRYRVPLDREHLIGHDQVPGPTQVYQAGMHWDPGPYFDWSRFMRLVGAPIQGRRDHGTARVVTIDPSFWTNRPVVTYCDTTPCRTLPPQPSNFVYLHTGPSESSPLVADPLLAGTSLEPDGAGTTQAKDWGDKAVTGQTFAVAGRSGDWTAIWYGGQEAWFFDRRGSAALASHGLLVTPKAGTGSIPVYGRAYPDSVGGTATLSYTIPEGQAYVARDLVGADYYQATVFDSPADYQVITGPERYYEISFNHRIAFVRTSDVDVVR
jgi:N-acetyl-anhydromuramyl-L-alanine amidase AmpD